MLIRDVVKFVLVSVMFLLCACSKTPSKEVVTESIRKIMPPDFEIISIMPLKEIPGIIEVSVRMNKQPAVLYLDKKAKYLFSGSLLNIDTKQNLTIESQKNIK